MSAFKPPTGHYFGLGYLPINYPLSAALAQA